MGIYAEVTLAVALPTAILAPHAIRLHRAAPTTAAAVWLLTLGLRALLTVGTAIFVFAYLPGTVAFEAVVEWCWHQVLPVLGQHLALSGHPVGHAALVLPAVALALSLSWVLFGLTRAWLALRRLLARHARRGPLGSTIVPDQRVLVAVTTFGPGRIVVSDGALATMDEDELRASVAHERAHISRRHRPLLLLAAVLSALARPLPGTRAAERQLVFSLERDADACAVRSTRDPLALASAICKAATGSASQTLASSQALTPLGGRGSTTLRVRWLLAEPPHPPAAASERSARALIVVLAALVLGLTLALPASLLAAPDAGAVVAQGSAPCAR